MQKLTFLQKLTPSERVHVYKNLHWLDVEEGGPVLTARASWGGVRDRTTATGRHLQIIFCCNANILQMELIYFANTSHIMYIFEKVIKMTPANCFFSQSVKYGSTDKNYYMVFGLANVMKIVCKWN